LLIAERKGAPMRELAILSNESAARRFADYLLTIRITTRLEREGPGWVLWVLDEDRLAEARQELEQFVREPQHPRYQHVDRAAEKVRRDEDAAEQAYRKRHVDARSLWAKPSPARCLVTMGLIVISVAVTIVTNFGHNWESRFREPLNLVPYAIVGNRAVELGDWRYAYQSFQLWRWVTPIFLHFSMLHIIMNMWMLYDFGGRIETHRGWWRFALLVLISAVISNVAQSWTGSVFFGGMSGVAYALFGYLWMKTRFDPRPGLYLPPDTVVMGLVWLVICLMGFVGNIANTAHFVGLGVGVLAGGVRPLLRALRRRMRG
jgi:GlpG protein